MSQTRWLKYAGVGYLVALLQWALLIFLPEPHVPGVLLTQSLMASPVLYSFLYLLVMGALWTMVAASYELFDLRLTGGRLAKTSVFTLGTGLLWLLYLVEPLPHQAALSLSLELLKGVLLFLTLRALLAAFVATKRYQHQRQPFIYGRALLVFTGAVFVFRVIAYLALDIYQFPSPFNAFNFLWALLLGLAYGIVFCLLQRFTRRQDKKGKFLQFTLLYTAPLIMLYHVQLGLRFEWAWWDLLCRGGLDLVAVGVATFLTLQWQIDEFVDA